MPGQRILCVAEKPAIAKAVAQHLSGGRMTTVCSCVMFIFLFAVLPFSLVVSKESEQRRLLEGIERFHVL